MVVEVFDHVVFLAPCEVAEEVVYSYTTFGLVKEAEEEPWEEVEAYILKEAVVVVGASKAVEVHLAEGGVVEEEDRIHIQVDGA